jgi:hypothetical protein
VHLPKTKDGIAAVRTAIEYEYRFTEYEYEYEGIRSAALDWYYTQVSHRMTEDGSNRSSQVEVCRSICLAQCS